ncbi:outer membrane beta-barrel protein [uncultured Paludibaculum sp.]|uniref:outer membrane beta-barrel protein n=1 Tax=uncultured Paludibaculum sp. TaxID=1765020 RepID=UPI002AAAEC4B|nr:outer membrane beta-barrel protein [uncultured Paludibaculum sp.]
MRNIFTIHRIFAVAVCTLSAAGALNAQTEERPVSVGVIGGVGLNDPFDSRSVDILTPSNIRYSFSNHRYIVGPMVQVNLPWHLGLEVDALYRRYSYTSDAAPFDSIVTTRTSSNTWEFPLLLKYRVFGGPLSPFLVAGPNFRYVSEGERTSSVLSGDPNTGPNSVARELKNSFAPGFSIGGGVSLGAKSLKIEPQFRYTRWGWENFASNPTGFFKSNQNQVDFLLNVRF